MSCNQGKPVERQPRYSPVRPATNDMVMGCVEDNQGKKDEVINNAVEEEAMRTDEQFEGRMEEEG